MIKYNTICVDTDIDNTLSTYLNVNRDTEQAFESGIHNLSNFNTKDGYSFDSLTYLAVNYFYEHIFIYHDKDMIKHSFRTIGCTTLSNVKGYFDACNYTPYTPINTVDTCDFKQLYNARLYTECYLVIQVAYFFGSTSFRHHEYIDVVEHYRMTEKVKDNSLDASQLKRAFEQIDEFKKWNGKGKKPSQFSKDTYLNNWYYGVLDIIVNVFKSLGHKCKHFNYEFPIKNEKISEYRIYNKLIQTPRILRKVQPFEMVEFDIKSGHLSYIDLYTGSNVAKTAYDNYAKEHNITRDEAKRKFQSILNWRKFRETPLKQKQYHDTLCGFGYSPVQAKIIIAEITDAPDYLFGHFASKYELEFTNAFINDNYLKGTTRGHDAIYLLKERGFDYSNLKTLFAGSIIQFELKYFGFHNDNTEIEKRMFGTPEAVYFSGIRDNRLIVKNIIGGTLPPIKLIFNDYIQVFWCKGSEREQCFNVFTSINYHSKPFYYTAPKMELKNNLFDEMVNAYDTLFVLNNYSITSDLTRLIVQHIRKYLNFDIVYYTRFMEARCNDEFVPIIRKSQITSIYNEDKEEEYSFNTMVAQNKAEAICNEYLYIESLKEYINNWIFSELEIKRKPSNKKSEFYNLFLKLYKIDQQKTATSGAISSRIKNNNIIQHESLSKMAVFIAQNKGIIKPQPLILQIDSTRTKERKAKQMAFQTKKHQKLVDNYNDTLLLIKDVSSEIQSIYNIKFNYDIKTK